MPVYRFEDLPEVQHNPGLSSGRGQTIKGERIFFGKRTKKAGTGSKPHHHPSEQFLYVLKGALRVTIDGESHVAEAGGVIHIPANAMVFSAILGMAWSLELLDGRTETQQT